MANRTDDLTNEKRRRTGGEKIREPVRRIQNTEEPTFARKQKNEEREFFCTQKVEETPVRRRRQEAELIGAQERRTANNAEERPVRRRVREEAPEETPVRRRRQEAELIGAQERRTANNAEERPIRRRVREEAPEETPVRRRRQEAELIGAQERRTANNAEERPVRRRVREEAPAATVFAQQREDFPQRETWAAEAPGTTHEGKADTAAFAGEGPLSFRHELKFYLNRFDYAAMRNSLAALLRPDPNAGRKGEYCIRSLYFDDKENSALEEKLGGSDRRKKYRIRIYNFDDSFIRLEKKIKVGQYIAKRAMTLSRQEYEAILAGRPEFLLRRKEKLAKEFFLEIRDNGMHPTVIVDYIREPYIYPVDNVRITFDRELKTTAWIGDIFDPLLPTLPMYEPGLMVLEVKFDKFLPVHIRRVLCTLRGPQRSSSSKYVLCRKYDWV